MRYNNIFYLSLCLALFFIFKFSSKYFFLIKVQGRVELLAAEISKRDFTDFTSRPLKKSLVLAVKGKVKSIERDISIPIEKLPKKQRTTYTNSQGKFNFLLKPGVYTFFIVQGDNAYLNSFDGSGYYNFHKVSPDLGDILITVTSESYF